MNKYKFLITQHVDNEYVIEAESLEEAFKIINFDYGEKYDPVSEPYSRWEHTIEYQGAEQ